MMPAVTVTYQRKRMMLLALVVAVAAAMLLMACSGAVQQTASPSPIASADPFVGTWRVDSADATFVMSSSEGYRILAVSPGLAG